MAALRQKALIQRIKQQLQRCAGFEGDELDKHRRESLNYYFQRPRGDEVPGRSKVVAGDLSAMVEANAAQMMDSFTASRIAEFPPKDELDKAQIELESDTVAYFIVEQNNGWVTLQSAIKDALQMRNGVVKAWIEVRKAVRYEHYRNVRREALPELLARGGGEVTLLAPRWSASRPELKLRRTQILKRFRCEPVALENFLYPKDYDSTDLQAIPFCAERHLDSRSELIALGFPEEKVNKLTPFRQRAVIQGAMRNPGQFITDTVGPLDKSQELVEWYECYALMDRDGDGIAERRRIAVAYNDNEILEDIPVNLVPYAVGAVLINQHRLTGISLHDKLKQTQDKHTGLERALFDNINTTNKNRTASLDGAVNPDDLGDGRTNGNIRVNSRRVSDVRQAVMAFSVPDTSANILQNIEAVKRERAELGGAALDMQSAHMQLNERMGSEGVDRVYSVMEALAAFMTRNIGQTLIRNLWLLAHATLREGWNEPVPVYSSGKWESPKPTEWAERTCVRVKPGMSPGERARLANALAKYLDWQVALAREGMDEVLVHVDGFYKALVDWGRIMDIPLPEQYWRDPRSPAGVQAAEAKRAAAQAQDEQKKELMRQAIGLEQIRTAFDKYKQDTELQFKYWERVLYAEVEEAKIAGSATTELLKAKMKPAEAPEGGDGGKKGNAGKARAPRARGRSSRAAA